jgi:hypothetical protein
MQREEPALITFLTEGNDASRGLKLKKRRRGTKAALLGGLFTTVPNAAVLAQDAPPLDPNGAVGNRVFLISTEVTEEADVFVHQISPRVGRTVLICNEFIDPDQNLVPNWDVLNQALENMCAPEYEGVIVLNWEGPFFEALKAGPEHPNFYVMRQRGINVVNFVKNKLPNSKVGMYAIPSGKWNVDHSTLMPLYNVLNVMMPGGVIAQAGPEVYPSMVEKLRKNVEFALEIAGDRPVLAFHSPRHTHSDSVRVDDELWASHIAKTFDYEYEGKRAAGVIIWDPTIRMYFQGDLEEADAPYILPGMDIWDYITGIEIAYYCSGARSVIPEAECLVPPDDDETPTGDTVSDGNFQPPPDGFVNGADLAFMLGEWGDNPGSLADIVSSTTLLPPPDGKVDAADLAVLLGNWTE